ncbi:hypothetical protein [Rummeliibacillus stabekisii]
MKVNKNSSQKMHEGKDAWYFKENKFIDFLLPIFALIVSIIALLITLNN